MIQVGDIVTIVQNKRHSVPPEWLGATGRVLSVSKNPKNTWAYSINFDVIPAGWGRSMPYTFHGEAVTLLVEGSASEEL